MTFHYQNHILEHIFQPDSHHKPGNSIMNTRLIIFCSILLAFGWTNLACPQDNLSRWRAQLQEKDQQINEIERLVGLAQRQYHQVVTDHEIAKTHINYAKDVYENAKDSYERGTDNPDIVSPDTLMNLLSIYRSADQEYRKALESEKQLGNQRKNLEAEIERLVDQKSDKEIEILGIKATMFDEEMSRPVWSEGFGESILDEDKTMNECKELALTYAERDAIEKGGKAIIQSVTEIEDFQLIKDKVKSRAKVQVIERDNSGDYGKAIRVDEGRVIRFEAQVRLKLQSIDIYNPFRARIIDLRTSEVPRSDAESLYPLVSAFKTMHSTKKPKRTWIYIGGAAALVAGGTAAYFLLNEKEDENAQGTLSIRVPSHP